MAYLFFVIIYFFSFSYRFMYIIQTHFLFYKLGYHHDKNKLPGYEMGLINSYYYALPDRYDHMRHYYPIKQQFYAREFPAAWRLIDMTVPEQ
jgi:hypothetical protein